MEHDNEEEIFIVGDYGMDDEGNIFFTDSSSDDEEVHINREFEIDDEGNIIFLDEEEIVQPDRRAIGAGSKNVKIGHKMNLNNLKEPEQMYLTLLKEVESIMGKDSTSQDQLDDFMKQHADFVDYIGSHERKKLYLIKKLKPEQGMIINTKNSPGEHWCCLYKFNNGCILFYDSFGRPFKKLFGKTNKQICDTDKDREQDLNKTELNCGQRCITWLILANCFGHDFVKKI